MNGLAIQSYFDTNGGGVFDLINTFSGGAFKRFSVLALGIMPYITTSIIFTLLGEVIPRIQEMQEDAEGHRQIQKWVRYAAVLLCSIQGYGMAVMIENANHGIPLVPEPGFLFRITATITLAAGTMFLLWLGERITEYGLENGVSLIIFAGIAVELPAEIGMVFQRYMSNEVSGSKLLAYFAIIFTSFYIVSFIERSYRSVSVQYAKRVINNRMVGGTQPLQMRVDTGGVMPPILASALLSVPMTLAGFMPANIGAQVSGFFSPNGVLFNLMFSFFIVYMTFFYAPMQFKSGKIADSLQKNNAFIPGVRPGAKTKEFLEFILFRLSSFGALYLIVICVLPNILLNEHTRFSGTALLILVSVSMRVFMNVQSFLYADRLATAYKSKGKYNGANRRF